MTRWSTRIGDHEAHLWLVEPDDIRAPELLDAYDALLTQDERDKRDRFRFERDRHTCLVTRALVRTTLSRYVDVAPQAWRFETNEYGRPAIASPREAGELKFNLSHTRGMVACIVGWNRDVGVDVEDRDRTGRLLDVADRFFSPSEVRALRSLPDQEQWDRFFLYWTLKESYIKARGMGLAIPLSHFSFDVERDVTIAFDPKLDDTPERWQFTAFSRGRRHAVAASMGRKPPERVQLLVRETVPLR